MEKYKLIILCLTDGGPEHEQDYKTGRETWGKKIPAGVLLIYLKTDEKSSALHLKNNFLHVPQSISRNGILAKEIAAFKYIQEKYEFNFILRVNVSTYINLGKYLEELEDFPHMNYAAGYLIPIRLSGKREIIISGASMIFSRDVINKIIEMKYSYVLKDSDDIAISQFLESENIPLRFQSRSNISFNHIFYPNSIIRCKTSTNSELASKRFILIDKYFESKNFMRKIQVYLEIQIKEIKYLYYENKIIFLRNLILYSRIRLRYFFRK